MVCFAKSGLAFWLTPMVYPTCLDTDSKEVVHDLSRDWAERLTVLQISQPSFLLLLQTLSCQKFPLTAMMVNSFAITSSKYFQTSGCVPFIQHLQGIPNLLLCYCYFLFSTVLAHCSYESKVKKGTDSSCTLHNAHHKFDSSHRQGTCTYS